MPTMAIIDAQLMDDMPQKLTAATGIDALTHAIEAIASCMATDYTNAIAFQASKLIFTYLPLAYSEGSSNPIARNKMADAATMAGMAFANAFLGVCHSMAHKLGAYFHIPHGVANALLINEVIKFNATNAPTKMAIFPQYKYPVALDNYGILADYLGIKAKNPQDKIKGLIDKINTLKDKIKIPKSIKECGITENDFLAKLDQMSLDAFDDQCTIANPRYPLIKEIKQMYLNAFYGKTKK
jgi:acetaldehyde dehydrogenase/alcohol dehydrogenase